MENNKEGNGWMSVPTFGDWDMKNGTAPDYSMDFSKIREMRKQNKKEISRASLGNEEELVNNNRQSGANHDDRRRRPLCHGHVDPAAAYDGDHRRPLHHGDHRDHSPTGRKKFLSYFQCCIGA